MPFWYAMHLDDRSKFRFWSIRSQNIGCLGIPIFTNRINWMLIAKKFVHWDIDTNSTTTTIIERTSLIPSGIWTFRIEFPYKITPNCEECLLKHGTMEADRMPSVRYICQMIRFHKKGIWDIGVACWPSQSNGSCYLATLFSQSSHQSVIWEKIMIFSWIIALFLLSQPLSLTPIQKNVSMGAILLF